MKYKWKKITVLTLTAYMLGISTTGCSSAPAAEAEIKADSLEPIADEIDAAKKTDPSESSADKADAEETDPSESVDGQTKTETDAKPTTQDSSGKWKVYDPDVAAAVDADFEGVVYKIETDSFFITPTETTLEENGAIISASLSPGVEIPDEELVQVIFDDHTVFTLRDVYDGGERHEDSDASFQNIEKELSVALKGTFQNDVFCADQIRIIKVH